MATPKDLATRQQVYLERLKAGFVQDWEPVQASLRRRVREVMTALEVDTLGELSRARLNLVLAQLQDAHLSVTTAGMLDFAKQLAPLAAYSAGFEVAQMAAAGGPKFNAPTAKLAYEYALRSPVQATGELLKPFVETWPALDAERLTNIVRTGWAQNKSLMDMVRELVGTRNQSYKNGALEVSRRDAGAIIHTATQHTANAARMKVWEDNSDLVKGYTWVSTLDRRTTQQCRSLDGRTFEPGKGPMPPLHIRCRSTTVADLGPEWDWLDEGATRASSGPNPGYVDAEETYYSWLKRQPAEFQDRAIGKTRGQLLRNGGLTSDEFARLNLGRDFQPLTLAQMRELEPDAFAKAGLGDKKFKQPVSPATPPAPVKPPFVANPPPVPTRPVDVGRAMKATADDWDARNGFYAHPKWPIDPETYQKNWASVKENRGLLKRSDSPEFFTALDDAIKDAWGNESVFTRIYEKGPKAVVTVFEGQGLSNRDFGKNSDALGHVTGFSIQLNNRMTWALDKTPSTPVAFPKSGTVGTDLPTVLRHEYGHVFWDNALSEEKRAEFFSLVKDPSAISGYAASLSQEVFPEALALVSHPDFNRANFPDWVGDLADWFERL